MVFYLTNIRSHNFLPYKLWQIFSSKDLQSVHEYLYSHFLHTSILSSESFQYDCILSLTSKQLKKSCLSKSIIIFSYIDGQGIIFLSEVIAMLPFKHG